LIKRFIDSEAEFLFVPRSRVKSVAQREGALSFDAPEADFDHEGELCTFDVLIREYGLTDRALLRLARIVNAADTRRLDRDPLAAGFEAIAVGYGLRFPDDRRNLKKQFEVYDALYAWCSLQVAKES
jgi:hypothetical protein